MFTIFWILIYLFILQQLSVGIKWRVLVGVEKIHHSLYYKLKTLACLQHSHNDIP